MDIYILYIIYIYYTYTCKHITQNPLKLFIFCCNSSMFSKLTKDRQTASYHGSNHTCAATALAEAGHQSTVTAYAMTRIIHTASRDIIDGQMEAASRSSAHPEHPSLETSSNSMRKPDRPVSAEVKEQQQ